MNDIIDINADQAPFGPVEYFFSLDGFNEATAAEQAAFIKGFETAIEFFNLEFNNRTAITQTKQIITPS